MKARFIPHLEFSIYLATDISLIWKESLREKREEQKKKKKKKRWGQLIT